MTVADQPACVLKHGRRAEGRRSRFEVGGCVDFINLVDPVCADAFDHAPLPAAPPNFDPHFVGRAACRKYPNGVVG